MHKFRENEKRSFAAVVLDTLRVKQMMRYMERLTFKVPILFAAYDKSCGIFSVWFVFLRKIKLDIRIICREYEEIICSICVRHFKGLTADSYMFMQYEERHKWRDKPLKC